MEGYIDLIFSNCFIKEEFFCFFDQEWKFEVIPTDFILYRAITNLYRFNSFIETIISMNELLSRYNIDEYKINHFKDLDERIMNRILDKHIVEYLETRSQFNDSNCIEESHSDQINKICNDYESEIKRIHEENSNELNNKNNQIKSIVEDYEKEIDRLQNVNNSRVQEIQGMNDSRIKEICSDYESEIARLNAIISEHSIEMSLIKESNKELELYKNETQQNYILVRKAWKSYFKK